MRGGDHSYPGVQLAVWNVTENRLHCRYFPANFFKLVTTPILPVGQLWSADCYATTSPARQYLTNINSKVFLNLITTHHCQETLISQYFSIWPFWHLFSFSFPERSIFLPRNNLSSNRGFNYLDNLNLFSISLSFRIQGLGTAFPFLTPQPPFENLTATWSNTCLLKHH